MPQNKECLTENRKVAVAWAAGILEGEGSFILKTGTLSPRVTIQMTDLDVLQKIQAIFGGRIYKSTKAKDHYKDCWVWIISSAEDAVECIKEVLPFLCERRTMQAQHCLGSYTIMKSEQEAEAARIKMMRESIKKEHSEGGVTHRKLADKFGLSRSYVSHILRGRFD